MIDRLLGFVAPHHCYNCSKTGAVLCDNCKYDIVSEPYGRCIACTHPAGASGICRECRPLPYAQAWCVGERDETVRQLIDGYKFDRVQASHGVIADLLLGVLPDLPPDTIVVPVPTIAPHIRQRGYDHTLLISRRIARVRGLAHSTLLQRRTNTKQFGSSRSTRLAQAKRAFAVHGVAASNRPYLLVDDVFTTGATMRYAATQLRAAGAREVWLAVVARQPMSK